jgi:hypothetical protein
MRENWDDHAEIGLAASTGNDPMLTMILRLLGSADRDYAFGVLEIQSLWTGIHSHDPPEWVESNDTGFARVIADFFTSPDHECLSVDRRAGRCLSTRAVTPSTRSTLAGRALALSRPCSTYMCLSANSAAESASNTTFPGEITTGGGGLIRAQATYAHTGSTNVTTLTKTFTANGSDALSVVIAKIGVLNAASVGTLGYEKLLTATATLNVAGDNVAITHTITAG